MTVHTNTSTAVVDRINEMVKRGDMEGFLSCCTDDVVWTMVGGQRMSGKAAIREWLRSMPSVPPGFRIRDTIGDGDVVVSHGDMTMEEDGRQVPYRFCDIYRFRSDKVAALESFVMKSEPAERARTAGGRA
jgi:ketosteroid isomerase-like protein